MLSYPTKWAYAESPFTGRNGRPKIVFDKLKSQVSDRIEVVQDDMSGHVNKITGALWVIAALLLVTICMVIGMRS